MTHIRECLQCGKVYVPANGPCTCTKRKVIKVRTLPDGKRIAAVTYHQHKAEITFTWDDGPNTLRLHYLVIQDATSAAKYGIPPWMLSTETQKKLEAQLRDQLTTDHLNSLGAA